MLYADVANIREVILFPALRPEEKSQEGQVAPKGEDEPQA
jgi:hypothetical protein